MLLHFPIIQILITLLGALLAALSFNKRLAYIIALVVASASALLAFYVQYHMNPSQSYHYNLGQWQAPIGIEYSISYLEQASILTLDLILLFILAFQNRLIEQTILAHLDQNYAHIFYSILLLAHTGYLGIISSLDAFNIYVFLEVASLSIYILLAQGGGKTSLIGAFDYLIMGTIGATLILVSIGFFLAATGSLNLHDIQRLALMVPNTPIIKVAGALSFAGIMLKAGLFPMHFALSRAYNFAPAIIVAYISAVSGIFIVSMLMKLTSHLLHTKLLSHLYLSMIRPLSLSAMVIFSIRALMGSSLRKLVVHASCASIGYVFLLSTISSNIIILYRFLLFDACNKLGLFTIVAHHEYMNRNHGHNNSNNKNIPKFLMVIISLFLMFSASIPPTANFVLKLDMISYFITQEMYITIAVIAISSVFAILYHLKIARMLFFRNKITPQIQTSQDIPLSPAAADNIAIDTTSDYLYYIIIIVITQFSMFLLW